MQKYFFVIFLGIFFVWACGEDKENDKGCTDKCFERCPTSERCLEACLEACAENEADADADVNETEDAATESCKPQRFQDCEGAYDHVLIVPQGCACPRGYYNSGIGCLGIVDGCSALEATGTPCVEAQQKWEGIFYEKAIEGYLCWPY